MHTGNNGYMHSTQPAQITDNPNDTHTEVGSTPQAHCKGQIHEPGSVPGLQALSCAWSIVPQNPKCCRIHSTAAATWLTLTDTVHGHRAPL